MGPVDRFPVGAKLVATAMVRIQGQSDYEKLDAVVQKLVSDFDFRLDVTGWTRKTYSVYSADTEDESGVLLARIESFATTNGEITVFDKIAMPFAEKLGAAIEEQFDVKEAVVVERPRPA